ncbi:hypothetical protein l11_06660 [Neisseria weaveri LMG 5135]|nr:hypothetical protein l13_13050 [Neisseria weaveri ATCC 51223]EGV38342.1 hypothetical protein l11_06660 [Neisseria weaveri LMG 5135]
MKICIIFLKKPLIYLFEMGFSGSFPNFACKCCRKGPAVLSYAFLKRFAEW